VSRARFPVASITMIGMDRRVLIGIALAIALAIACFWWLTCSPAVQVTATRAREGPLTVRVITNGKVEPIEDVEVRARLDGRIVEIPEPGTEVAKGDVVLRIDAGPVSADLANARSERLAANESLREARDALVRIQERAAADRKLFEEGAITQERNAESAAELRDARARVEYSEKEVPLRVASLDLRIEELEAQQASTEVSAPFDGTVYRTERRKGQAVRVGDPILRIADLERLRVRANIDQVDLGRVRAGQRVHITSNAFPDRSWSGLVSEVIPHVVVRESRSISEGLARVDPPTDGLVPGMSVDVEIVVAESPNALQIPAEAVFRTDGAPFVFRIEGGRARKSPVTLGLETVTAVEVEKGLSPEDRVVVGPLGDLRDGDRVEARMRDDGER
jgi:RND family efflux transporter MFP subunit